MSSVVSFEVPQRAGLKLDPRPFRKDWFDEPGVARGIEVEQERLAGASRIFARHGFDQGLVEAEPELLS